MKSRYEGRSFVRSLQSDLSSLLTFLNFLVLVIWLICLGFLNQWIRVIRFLFWGREFQSPSGTIIFLWSGLSRSYKGYIGVWKLFSVHANASMILKAWLVHGDWPCAFVCSWYLTVSFCSGFRQNWRMPPARKSRAVKRQETRAGQSRRSDRGGGDADVATASEAAKAAVSSRTRRSSTLVKDDQPTIDQYFHRSRSPVEVTLTSHHRQTWITDSTKNNLNILVTFLRSSSESRTF